MKDWGWIKPRKWDLYNRRSKEVVCYEVLLVKGRCCVFGVLEVGLRVRESYVDIVSNNCVRFTALLQRNPKQAQGDCVYQPSRTGKLHDKKLAVLKLLIFEDQV